MDCWVQVGDAWVAAATSQHHLRIFSSGGIQSHIMAMEGRPVSVVGHHNLLACVWVAGAPTPPAGTQNLQVIYII